MFLKKLPNETTGIRNYIGNYEIMLSFNTNIQRGRAFTLFCVKNFFQVLNCLKYSLKQDIKKS